jgi:hypothetical protein
MAGTELDLSNIPLEDLLNIHNQVLRRVAAEAKINLGTAANAHDSHSSSHSKYSRTLQDFQEQIDQITKASTKGGRG